MRNEYSTENGNKLILHTLPASQGWLVLRNAGEKLAAKISPNLHPTNSILSPLRPLKTAAPSRKTK